MKRGFTLMELIVYMALLGFVIVVAGRVFSDSTVMRVRSQSMVKTSEEVGKISHLIKEDISQMGVKAWGQANSSNSNSGSSNSAYNVYNVGTSNPKIYWDQANKDVSSYALTHKKLSDGTFRDKITFRKADFDGAGHFIGIREIEWEALENSNKLVRRCATLPNPVCPTGATCATTDIDASVCPTKASASLADTVVMAENITNFHIIPSKPGKAGNSQDTLFGKAAEPDFRLLKVNGGSGIETITNTHDESTNTATLSGFAQNSNSTGGTTSYNELCLAKNTSGGCEPFTFEKDETYVIEFKMPFDPKVPEELQSTQFVPGRDHLAIGLRTSASGVTLPNDILFFPAQSKEASTLIRSLEFTMKQKVENVQVVMTIAYYPPPSTAGQFNGAEGILKFNAFKIFRKADETFHFPVNEDYGTTVITEKNNAKAFELILEIDNRGEKSGTYSVDDNKNKKGMVIPTPNNGVTPN